MVDTTLLRFIAILLITNSHLDGLYPYAAMSTGGQLGNSLFFMLSGFGLVSSYLKKGDSFGSWLTRRLSRIYPPVFVVTFGAALVTGAFLDWNPGDFAQHLIWPTEYWFVAAIVVFYVPFYWFMRMGSGRLFILLILALFIPYFYFYLTMMDLARFSIEGAGYFKWIFYFQVMLLGGYLAYPNQAVKSFFTPTLNAVLLGFSVAAYLGVKFIVAKGVMTEFQFLVHWLTFPIMVFSLYAMDTHLVRIRIKKWAIWSFMGLVAGATLEIYLLQKYIYGNPLVASMSYPLNVAVFWPVVIVGGILIASVSSRLSSLISKSNGLMVRPEKAG
jgi:peptidoglycan/LPS O-acetylase OafA/YrhL